MGLALGQTPSMRNRQGQHLVHELYCGSRHHPEGLDDRLTLIALVVFSIPSEGSLDHGMNASMSAITARGPDPCRPKHDRQRRDHPKDSAHGPGVQPDACLSVAAPMIRVRSCPSDSDPQG